MALRQRASRRLSRPANSAVAANSDGGTPSPCVRAASAEDVERFLQPALVLQEVGVGGEGQTEARGFSALGGDGVGDTAEVRGLRRVAREVPHVAPHGLELPAKAFARHVVVRRPKQPVHEAGDHVGAQR